jgi:hypothetical protein
VIKVFVKCIHCGSEDVVKMGKQPSMELLDVNVIRVAKPFKPTIKIVEPHLKPNK